MGIDFEVRDRIAVIRLNRPEAMNSIDPDMRKELQHSWIRINDDSINVVLLTGAGDRAFCTGSDLKKTNPGNADAFGATMFGPQRGDHLLSGLDTDKPLICAINGYALGGGLELALACDIRIAASTARFGLTEVKLGSIPGAGGTQLLPRTVGRSNAMMMMMTGDQIDAEEALRIGLVSQIVPPTELFDAAWRLAEKIAANAPLSVRAVKRLVVRGLETPLSTAMDFERLAFGALRDTQDRIEGRRAFQEKRKPNYQGK